MVLVFAGRGRGFGGRGLGRFGGRAYGGIAAPAEEREALKREADYLKRTLDGLNARIGELEKDK